MLFEISKLPDAWTAAPLLAAPLPEKVLLTTLTLVDARRGNGAAEVARLVVDERAVGDGRDTGVDVDRPTGSIARRHSR